MDDTKTMQMIQQRLDAYGADLERWPDDALTVRVRSEALLIDKPQREEAAALDRVLARAEAAAAGAPPPVELLDRIMAGASPVEDRTPDVVELTPTPREPRQSIGYVNQWPQVAAAALMAASLAVGLYVGAIGLMQPTVEGLRNFATTQQTQVVETAGASMLVDVFLSEDEDYL